MGGVEAETEDDDQRHQRVGESGDAQTAPAQRHESECRKRCDDPTLSRKLEPRFDEQDPRQSRSPRPGALPFFRIAGHDIVCLAENGASMTRNPLDSKDVPRFGKTPRAENERPGAPLPRLAAEALLKIWKVSTLTLAREMESRERREVNDASVARPIDHLLPDTNNVRINFAARSRGNLAISLK